MTVFTYDVVESDDTRRRCARARLHMFWYLVFSSRVAGLNEVMLTSSGESAFVIMPCCMQRCACKRALHCQPCRRVCPTKGHFHLLSSSVCLFLVLLIFSNSDFDLSDLVDFRSITVLV